MPRRASSAASARERSTYTPESSSSSLCSGRDLGESRSLRRSMSLLAILVLGFALGMRHATDADHVVAVSTIVSRERSLPRALGIGALWGAGHTLVLVVVGSLILAFDLMVPD